MTAKIKAEKDGYKLVIAGRGRYFIDGPDGSAAGMVLFAGGKWHAQRRPASIDFNYVEASAQTVVAAFEAVIQPTYEERLSKLWGKVDSLREGFLSTADHCLIGAEENLFDSGLTERTEPWFQRVYEGFWSAMDEYHMYQVQYGDDFPYKRNIENDITDGLIEAI